MRRYHIDGTTPPQGVIFVFGSNMRGRHGAGAAAVALRYYGAKYAVWKGHEGLSYAIPTKSVKLMTLARLVIEPYVKEFTRYTREHPELEFFCTRVGCGLAGYDDAEIAPMFKDAGPNCSFAMQWKPYLEDDNGEGHAASE